MLPVDHWYQPPISTQAGRYTIRTLISNGKKLNEYWTKKNGRTSIIGLSRDRAPYVPYTEKFDPRFLQPIRPGRIFPKFIAQ